MWYPVTQLCAQVSCDFYPGTVAGWCQCSGVRITACGHEVKQPIHVCSCISATVKFLAVCVKLPSHKDLTNKGLQSLSLHCVLAQQSLFSFVDCTWALSPASFGLIPPRQLTLLCPSKIINVFYSPF